MEIVDVWRSSLSLDSHNIPLSSSLLDAPKITVLKDAKDEAMSALPLGDEDEE
jgi:hypothetical protein